MWLEILAGQQVGKVVRITGTEFEIGRDPNCNLVIKGRRVQPRHARLILGDDHEILLHDLDSTSGTFVNDCRVNRPLRLQGNEHIRIGRSTFRLSTDHPRTTASRAEETTRYLCAAAYLDPKFRDDVLSQVFNKDRRAVAPSHGVDVAKVVRHCLDARDRARVRDAVLTALVLGMLAVGVRPALLPLAITAWLVVLLDTLFIEYWVVARRLSHQCFDETKPAARPEPGRPEPCRRWARGLLRILTAKSYFEKRLAELAEEEQGNVVVYSGYSPFVGSGYDVGAWSFAINVRRPKNNVGSGKAPEALQAVEVHRHVAESVRSLRFEGLTVEDRLFVSGQHIRDDGRLLPDDFSRPRAYVDPQLMDDYLRKPTPTARVYMVVRIVDWQGELVFSTFVRFSKTGDCLFMEASHCVLPSLHDHYHEIDQLTRRPTLQRVAVLARRSAVTIPVTLISSTMKTSTLLFEPFQRFARDHSTRQEIRENYAFNYGASTSLRERGTANAYQRYFQLLDKEMYVKIVDRCLLDTVIAFLDSKGIDTSDLRRQSQHIYNSGVMVSGGVVNSQNVVAGTGARATVASVLQTAANAVGGSTEIE